MYKNPPCIRNAFLLPPSASSVFKKRFLFARYYGILRVPTLSEKLRFPDQVRAEAVRILVAEVNIQDYEGQIPLWLAIHGDHYHSTRSLLENGATPDIALMPRSRSQTSALVKLDIDYLAPIERPVYQACPSSPY